MKKVIFTEQQGTGIAISLKSLARALNNKNLNKEDNLNNSNFKEPNSKAKSNNSSVKLRGQRRKEKKLIKETMEIPNSWCFYRKPNGFVSIVGEIADSEEDIKK